MLYRRQCVSYANGSNLTAMKEGTENLNTTINVKGVLSWRMKDIGPFGFKPLFINLNLSSLNLILTINDVELLVQIKLQRP
jgi:hypothetical protein